MAIGFNLANNYAQPSSSGFGGVDLVSAISKGMQAGMLPRQQSEQLLGAMLANKIKGIEAKYAPQMQQANLQHALTGNALNNLKLRQLQNEISQNELFNNLMSGMGGNSQATSVVPNVQIDSLNGANESVAPQGIQSIDDFSDNGMPAEGPGIAKSASAYDTFPGRRKNTQNSGMSNEAPSFQDQVSSGMGQSNKNVIEPGNPSLYKIDEMYDNYPQFRKQLESRGFKKTQTVKFDPKTGLTTVLTQKPSGKVEAKMIGSMNDDFSPATIANKTQSQKVINAIQNARPVIQKIIDEAKQGDVPGQWLGKYFSPDLQASYLSDVIQSSDTLAGALGFPATNEGLHQAQQTVLRQPRETDAGYVKRLQNLLKDMDTREKTATNVLKSGVSITNKKDQNNTTKELVYNPATGRLE